MESAWKTPGDSSAQSPLEFLGCSLLGERDGFNRCVESIVDSADGSVRNPGSRYRLQKRAHKENHTMGICSSRRNRHFNDPRNGGPVEGIDGQCRKGARIGEGIVENSERYRTVTF